MLPTDIAKTLNELRDKTVEDNINHEWTKLQKSLEKDLMDSAKQGESSLQFNIIHEPNVKKLQETLKDLAGITVETLPTQRNGTKVTIRF